MSFSFEPIAHIESCFKEKFGIPRQPGLVGEAVARIKLVSPYCQPESVKGLEQYSHIWVQFVFHESIQKEWKATVRPPKMGGNKRIGVFATRSNFRANPIGLSVVKLEKIEVENNKVILVVKGGDFLDGTPVLDIKPYVPYSDVISEAKSGLSCPVVAPKALVLSPKSQAQLLEIEKDIPSFFKFISELLQNDPRPGYQKQDDRVYGCHIYDYNLMWKCSASEITVVSIDKLTK